MIKLSTDSQKAVRTQINTPNEFIAAVVGCWPWLLHRARRLRGNPDNAYDLAADVRLTLLQTVDRYNPDRPLLPWAWAMLLHSYIDHCRRHAAVRIEADSDGARYIGAQAAGHTDLRAQLGDVLRALSALRQRQRTPSAEMLLQFALGYTYTELASRYGIDPDTVKSRLRNCRRQLAKMLE